MKKGWIVTIIFATTSVITNIINQTSEEGTAKTILFLVSVGSLITMFFYNIYLINLLRNRESDSNAFLHYLVYQLIKEKVIKSKTALEKKEEEMEKSAMAKTYVKKSETSENLWLIVEGQYILSLKKMEWGFSAGWGKRVNYSLRRTVDGTWEYRLGNGRAWTFDEKSADLLERKWNLAEI